MFPNDLNIKNNLDEILINKYANINKTLSSDRIDFLNEFKQYFKSLKSAIFSDNLGDTINIIEKLRSKIKIINEFDTISVVSDLEHEDILIDAMREINNDYILFTNEIKREKLGPHFINSLKKIKNFLIILNKKNANVDESDWNLGISKLEQIKTQFNNLDYRLDEKDYIFNSLYVKGNFLFFTNYKFLTLTRKLTYKYHLKTIGIVCYLKNVDEIGKGIIEKINILM